MTPNPDEQSGTPVTDKHPVAKALELIKRNSNFWNDETSTRRALIDNMLSVNIASKEALPLAKQLIEDERKAREALEWFTENMP